MARFARQTERSGGQKGRGLWGRNFCPPSLSAAAEIRILQKQKTIKNFLLRKMRRRKQNRSCPCPDPPVRRQQIFTPKNFDQNYIL